MLPIKSHEQIRSWAAKHNAAPAEKLPLRVDSEPALLTFLIGTAHANPQVVPISWDTFFAKFDLLDLAFAHDDNHSSRFALVHVQTQSGPAPEH